MQEFIFAFRVTILILCAYLSVQQAWPYINNGRAWLAVGVTFFAVLVVRLVYKYSKRQRESPTSALMWAALFFTGVFLGVLNTAEVLEFCLRNKEAVMVGLAMAALFIGIKIFNALHNIAVYGFYSKPLANKTPEQRRREMRDTWRLTRVGYRWSLTCQKAARIWRKKGDILKYLWKKTKEFFRG